MARRHQEVIPMRNLLAFGDSNTWGLVPRPGSHERFPWDMRWTGILQSKLPGVRVIEEGLCGRTTVFEDELRPGRRGLNALPVILDSQSPVDFAILMLGTNDCKTVYGVSAHTIGKGIVLCLNVMESYLDPSRILLVSPLYLGEDVWRPGKDPEFDRRSVEVSRELKDVYRDIASRRGNGFLAASDYVTPSSIDDEHMDDRGHLLFAQAVYGKLREIWL